jgi:hypothetical protein
MTELLAGRTDQPELSVFGCHSCGLSYFTTGHVSIFGQARSRYVHRAIIPERAFVPSQWPA